MKKKPFYKLSPDAFRILLLVLGSVLSTVVMVLSIFALMNIQNGDLRRGSVFLLFIFIVLGLSRLVTFIKLGTKVSLVRFITLFIFDIGLGVLVFFGQNQPYFYSLGGGLYCLSVIVSRIFMILQKRQVRNIVFNSIIIVLFAFFSVALFIPYNGTDLYEPVFILCVVMIITSLMEVLSNVFSQLKLKVLGKIIFKTFALEILLGFLTMIVAASLVFTYYEPDVYSFGDGLWYSFAVVTTIGFGDIVAKTIIGRVVTVLLGIYGIIVVAVITSIIVNFYNETAGKKDNETLKDIKKEEDKKQK